MCEMNESCSVSVILPVRNGDPAMLRRAADSVLRQTDVSFELLLIDDGSEEDFRAGIDEIAGTDRRIRVMHLEPSGVSAARNLAIREARGGVITFLDCDDALPPHCFLEAMQVLTDHPELDGIWGGTRFLDPAEMDELLRESAGKQPDESPDLILLSPERLHQTRAECIGEPCRFPEGYINRGIAARFLRAEALRDHSLYFPEGFGMYEDTIWNLEMMETLALAYVPRIWYYYLDNMKSVSNRFHRDGLERIEQPLERIRKMLDLNDPTEYTAYTRFLMDSLRYVCKTLYHHPDWHPEAGEKQRLKHHLYTSSPWSEIGSARFRTCAEQRDRKKAALYRMRLLLAWWGIK